MSSEAIKADPLALIQLDDAHRACLTALCAIRSVASNATGTLLSESQRLHTTLCDVADAIAELRSKGRVVTVETPGGAA